MSSKKFVYLLMTVVIVCGFIASDIAYGQAKSSNLVVKGTVWNADGTAATGHTVAGEIAGASVLDVSPGSTGPDGGYQYAFISLSNEITAGDIVTLTVSDSAQNVVGVKEYIVKAEDLPPPSIVELDISLAGLSVELEKSEVPADGISTSQITVTVEEDGNPVTGDTVTISADRGSVSTPTDNGDGTYIATYTAPSLALTAPVDDEISVRSDQLDQEKTTSISLTVVPTTVDVTVDPNQFTADTPGTGAVTITVKRGADLISDETVTVGLSRSDGKADTGTISPVTNNGDGTYSATYTSGGTVGSITLTARAAQADVRATAAITVNAGPPTEISLRALPDTVSSYGSSIITATVRDAAGNGVGGLILAATTSSIGGTLTPFLADTTQFGGYTATYTAPVVEVEGTETITVTVNGISAEQTLTLNPIPPKEVSIIIIEGVVYKEGGEVPVSGIDVTVTIGDKPPQMKTTGEDGTFTVSVVNPGGVAARTGDIVTIVVTDDTGERGSDEFVLTNEHLEDDDNPDDAVVSRKVETDITATSTILVVEGTVYLEDGLTAATSNLREGGLTVVVTNTTRNRSLPPKSVDSAGRYDVTFFDPSSIVAETGDEIAIEVQNDAGEVVGTADRTLTTAQVDAGGANINVTTHLIADSVSLAVFGTVFLEDGLTAATSALRDDDLTVVVTNIDRNNVQGSGVVRDDGRYTATLFNPPDIVAQTGDELTVNVEVRNSAGETVGPPTPHTLTTAEVAAKRAEVDLITDLVATSAAIVVNGTVYLKNGDGEQIPATSNFVDGSLTVVATNTTVNVKGTGIVRGDGKYTVTLFSPPPNVAETHNQLIVEVQNDAGEVVGTADHTLTTAEVAAKRVYGVDVHTELLAKINSLLVLGSVVELDGSPAGAGLAATVTLVMNGEMRGQEVLTDSAGRYEALFFDPDPVVVTGDRLIVEVSRADGFHGHAEINPLRSSAIVYQNQPLVVAPIKMLPPIKALGGLSINPNYIAEERSRISREAIQTNPALLEMIPSGILHLDLLKGLLSTLPDGFDPTNAEINRENFGNAITPKPAWHVLGEGSPSDPGRWLNSDLLSLYVLTGPTADSVIFSLSGAQSGTVGAERIAVGGTVPYTFQLEEERAVLFLPSWDGLNEGMSVFGSVDLMIDGQAIPMAQNMDTGIWEAEAQLMPGSKVSYYYQVKLAQSYQLGEQTVADWAMPDPRNLQVEDLGIVESLLAPELGPDLIAIVTTKDLKLRSVFNVPSTHALQSLWVYTFDLSNAPDGMYQLDTTITHADTVITDNSDYVDYVETIGTQMFMVDRSAPTAKLTLAIGESSGLYSSGDGQYVAAAKGDDAALTVTATPTGDPMDPGAYLYQSISLDAAGNPGVQVWNPASLTTDLPLTYMEPHQVTLPIGGENSLMGHFGLRAAGIDSILNISSSTMPTTLEVVPPDPDNAAVTVVHADYNGDGTADGRFESVQNVSDGVTIFSDRSNVALTLEIVERTKHPLTTLAIDFQINGQGDWKPIKHYTAAELANIDLDVGSQLTIHWDRTEDFADLLDMRGQAMVRVTVANALDVVRNDSRATFEIVPPALQLGGLSINTGYEAGMERLQALQGLDVTALATNLLQSDPTQLISPSPLPLALALLGMVSHIQSALPDGFEAGDEQIHRENFGNAITPKPIWYPIASAGQQDSGRWINGNQLHLYTFAGPTAESVAFSISGAQTAMAAAERVEAGGTFSYNFQLEEELVAIFAGSMPAFAGVTLMIDGHGPIDMVGNAGIWSAEAALTPNSKVSYYYRVTLTEPYQDMFINRPIQVFPIPDPRNLQMESGYVEQSIIALLNQGLDALDTLDPGLRSTFTVPAVDDHSQSLWVGKLDFPADGMYQLDVAVEYSSGSTDELTGKMFTVDRTAPSADTAVHLDNPGENIGMYMRDADGIYVATALPNPGAARLNVSATPIDDSDLEAYLYQFARLDDATGMPGTWNPMLTADLMSLDFTNGLPLTLEHDVQMLVRSATGNDLDYATYGLRVVGIDNILNADSSRGPGVVLELVPPDPDIAEVSYVTADFDGNGAIAGLETQSTAGDVVVFSDSLVTLTVDVVERTVHPLASIAIEVEMPGVGSQPVAMFSGDQLAATMLGDQFTVTLPVPDVPVLPDRGAQVILRTVTTNALNVVSTQEVSVAYERRTLPEVSAIHTYVTDRHPDSGAAQGTITVSAFTQAMTAPNTAAVQLEIRRSADAEWAPLGIVQLGDTTVTSSVQLAIIEDLVNAILSGAPTAPISALYREWPLTVDSTTLEDTIMDDSPAASDASLDDNPYVLRAIAVNDAGTGYPSADGVTDSFSIDNYSPTAITQVANEVEMVAAREDGSYYVSGLIAEGVPDPMLTLTSRTGAHPNAFTGGLKLAINDAAGAAVAIDETVFDAAGNHNYTAAFNLASIPNGVYTVMAVGHTADGAPEERIVAMAITVEVGNFTPPDNFADPTVDILSVTNTRGQANSPSDTDAMYPIGLPAVGDEACATLIVPNVSAGDVDVLIGEDLMSAAMMGALTVMDPDANNNILVCIDTSGLDEGMYSLVGVVSKPNGSVQFGLPSIRVDRSAPVIEIVSPLEGHQVTSLPTVQVAYTDDAGFDPEKTDPMPVEITLTRLGSDKTVDTNPSMIRMIAAAGEVLTQTGSIVYTHDDPLAGGAYRIDVSVTDTLGNTATAEPVEFTSSGVPATVSIITPASGQVVDPDQALIISAAFTGIGEITVDQLLINGGTYKPQSVKGNLLTHTIQPPFGVLFKRGSGNRITIKIVDEEGNTAEATTNFAIAKDVTPPVVATYSPQGIIRTDRPIAAATVTDASGIKTSSLTIIIAGVPGNQGTGRRSSRTSTTVTFTPSIAVTPGPYTARVTVEDVHGNRTEAEWQFTVELDVTPPAITTNSPQGVIRSDKPIISVSASDDMSGVDTIEIGVKGEGNQAVEGVTSVRSDKTSATFTPAASLTSGTYTVDVKLADVAGNKASGQWQFTVELDTIPPSITITRPMQEHTENRRPIISASYTDNLSGVDAESITLSLDGAAIEPDAVSETQVMFTPTFDLAFGQHTVKLEVSDMAPSANTAVQEWSFSVERMGIANARNYPNPFDGDTTIALRISRQASITVQIYDFTGRLVAEPLTNSVREAGPVEIEWDGQTSAGDNLARGVYFCHILMESELEPQSAILKMAVISD